MTNPIKYFQCIYPSDIQIYTLIFVFHMMRKTLFNQRRVMGDTTIDASTFLLFFCIICNLWIVFRNRQSLYNALEGSKLYLGYIIVCFLSFSWSITPAFETIFTKDLEILSSFLAIAVAIYKIDNKVNVLYYVCILASLSALLGVVTSVRIGEMHTNTYTLVGGIGLLLTLGIKRYYNYFKFLNVLIIINATALIVGTSSASYISFIFAFLVYLSAMKNKLNILNVIIIFALAYIILPYIEDTVYQYVFYGHSEVSIKGGTGRYEVWGKFIDGWMKSPWLGYGYIIGERSFALITHTRAVVFSAHNGYLSVLIGTGLIGMAFFALYLIKTIYKNYIRCKSFVQSNEDLIIFPALIMLLINNSSYPALGSDWNYTFPPIIAMLCLIHQLEFKTNTTTE